MMATFALTANNNKYKYVDDIVVYRCDPAAKRITTD